MVTGSQWERHCARSPEHGVFVTTKRLESDTLQTLLDMYRRKTDASIDTHSHAQENGAARLLSVTLVAPLLLLIDSMLNILVWFGIRSRYGVPRLYLDG